MPLHFEETKNGIQFVFTKLFSEEIEYIGIFDYPMACLICEDLQEILKNWQEKKVDKKIKKLQKSTQKVVKEEKSLLKADKKHDKIIDKAKKSMKKGC
jgi:hypothetical protein